MCQCRLFNRDERGVTMIEFTLVASLILMLIASVLELSFLLSRMYVVSQATRDAIRAGRVATANCAEIAVDAFTEEIAQFGNTLPITTQVTSEAIGNRLELQVDVSLPCTFCRFFLRDSLNYTTTLGAPLEHAECDPT